MGGKSIKKSGKVDNFVISRPTIIHCRSGNSVNFLKIILHKALNMCVGPLRPSFECIKINNKVGLSRLWGAMREYLSLSSVI